MIRLQSFRGIGWFIDMSNPVFPVNCTKDQYTLIATNVTTVVLQKLKTDAQYLYTYKTTGGTAPTLRNEAVRIFVKNPEQETISKNSAIDIYIWCDNEDGILRTEDGPAGRNGFGSNITLDTFNNRVFSHEVFSISKRFTIPASGTINIVIDPTENGAYPFGELVVLPIFFQAFKAGPVNIDVYAGTDSDADGTLCGSTDRNQVDPIVPHLVVRLNPTINNIGAKQPPEFQIASNGTGASTVIGGSSKEDLIIKGTPAIRQTFQLLNQDNTNIAECVFAFNWFEVK